MTSPRPSVPLCICGDPLCEIPYGYCHCRCGQKTAIALRNHKLRGWKTGVPFRFVHQHGGYRRPTVEEAVPFKIDGVYCRLIPLTKGQYAIVDESWYLRLMQFKWLAHWCPSTGTYYALRNIRNVDGTRSQVWMHRYILGLDKDDASVGDHKNASNTLDNRRNNLRPADNCQSGYNRRLRKDNTTGYKGVCPYKDTGRFDAYITANKVQRWLGRYSTAEEANAVVVEARKRFHGEFGREK